MHVRTAEAKCEFDRWSNHYDRDPLQVFFFKPAHRMLLANLTAADRRVLDIGCGTGRFAASVLEHYPETHVWGVDLSDGMLRQCSGRCHAANGRLHVVQGDSERLPFADDSFDHIFMSHVISVVSDPFKLVREAQRVAKPGARLVIVNHFQSDNRFIALFEKWLCPLCTKLGWRSDLALQELIRQTGVQVDFRYKLESIDLWETVVITNSKNGEAPQAQVLAA